MSTLKLHATVLLAALAGTANAADVMTPEHVAKLRAVTASKLSPDGANVAYTLSIPRIPNEGENGSAWSELHVVDREGNSRGFVTGEVSVRSIGWRPGGRELTFLSKRGKDKNTALWSIALNGGEAQRLLEHDTSIGSYSFSPDGTRVAFLAKDEAPKRAKKMKDKGFNAEVYEEALLFTRVWIAEPGNDDWKPRKLDIEGNASELHWSPAGDRLAMAIAPTPLVDDGYMSKKVTVVDVASGDVVATFNNPGKLGQISWSPDGQNIAVISAEDIHDPSEGRLMVASAGGGRLKDIFPNFEGHVTSLAWKSPTTICFLTAQGTSSSLERIDVDGSNHKTLIPPDRVVMTDLSLSKDGTTGAIRSESPNHPHEIYTMSDGARFARRLTNSNPWLGELRMAKQEVIKHTARDGVELEGILIRPLDEEAGKRYPLIMCVHGGPEAHINHGWLTRYSYAGQVGAARGFAIFYPNYRGSTGRGVEFSKAGQADYGGKEFDDLVDAADHLVAMGLVDTDRIGITGGSYGGFATAWCTTKHTERFAAGVMFVGISDQISKSGSTDIPNEMFYVHARKRIWDDWQFFLERSPIYYVQQANTPLLIMHGKDDPRVHPSQSLELYRQLKILGNTPVRLVWYPGEGHGNRKAAARYDYNLRMLRWFEQYLAEGDQRDTPAPPADLLYPFEVDEKSEKAAG